MVIPTLDLDPYDEAFLADPFPFHAELRDAGPVVRLPSTGTLAVARYQEVRRVLSEWENFCSGRGVGIQDFAKEKPWRPQSFVLETDPPFHDRTRKVLDQVLAPAAIRALRQRLAEAAETLIDELLQHRTFDAISDLAEAYPLTVFPDAMGMKRENRRFLLPWGNMIFNSFGPANERLRNATADAEPVLAWLFGQVKREALAPAGFGAEIHVAADRGDLTEAEAEAVVRAVLSAGVDTTVSSLGAAVYCLARFPEQFQRLRATPSLARTAFEEAIRLETPVQTFFRTVTRATELGGERVSEGEKVLMFLGAANRDPRRWARPDEYDIGRSNAGHVGFGVGIHQCVGQVLARMEGECVLGALARKAVAIEITGPVERRMNNTLRGLTKLPVRLARADG